MTPPPVPHYVYRCYDAAGLLLYIGCTAHVKTRLTAHRAGSGTALASRWLQVAMSRYDAEGPYPTKADGYAAESNAIADEEPLFNRQGRRAPGYLVEARVADYLIEHGHAALAVETTCRCRTEYDNYCYTHELLSAEPTERVA